MELIGDIFLKDIRRNITGVVLVEQTDNDTVWQELDEFVITKELSQHFRKFFNSYLTESGIKIDPELVGSMGVWISGFFGSGKSHFIKILSHVLGNIKVNDPSGGGSKKALDFFNEKVKDPAFLGEFQRASRIDTEIVLFNIDSKANKNEEVSPILSTFWKVFNEKRGYSSDLKIAEIEYFLEKEKKYGDFCTEFQKDHSSDWEKRRDTYYLIKDDVVQTLSNVLDRDTKNVEEWLDNIENNFDLSIDNFSNRIKEYLDSCGHDKRIVFLVDEVGQFIGNETSLMLNLQTIVEDLGRICEGRAWVVVTSQEDIDAVLGDLKSTKSYDFSKIQGRFKTRLSLSSTNTDEVIKHRLLEKKEEYQTALGEIYSDKKDIIKHQFSFTSDNPTLDSFKNSDEFINNYPFIPYQFQLVQKIFESIRKAGATGLHLSRGERSMLDAFQSAAIESIESSKDVGSIVPLYDFYPCIENFLDTKVKRSIEQANQNTGLEIPFDIKMLQTLFLVRYVDILKPNIDNLVTISIDQIDSDRLALKKEIETSLSRLEREKLINKTGDHYFFLTDEEREVEREIENMETNYSDENKLISDMIFNEILRGNNKHRYSEYKRDYGFGRVCDSQPFSGKGEEDLTLEFITPLSDQYQEYNNEKCIFHSTDNSDYVVVKLADDPELSKEIRKYVKTEKYIRLKIDAAASTEQRKIQKEKSLENSTRKSRLKSTIDNLILESDVYVMGSKLEAGNGGSTAQSIIDKSLNYLIENTYSKFNYLEKLHEDPLKEIKAVLQLDDISAQSLNMDIGESLTGDQNEIFTVIDLTQGNNQQVILENIVKHFSKKPYGWPEFEVVLLVAKIFVLGKIDLLYDGTNLSPREAVDPLTKTNRWKNVKILKRKQHTDAEIKKAQELGRNLFGKVTTGNQEEIANYLNDELSKWEKELKDYQILARTGTYPGLKDIEQSLQSIRKLTAIHGTYEFIKLFNESKDKLLDLSDDVHKLNDFYTNQINTWNDLNEAINKFSPNEDELNKYNDAESHLSKLRIIREAPEPYGMIKDVNGLISKIDKINADVVKAKRKAALKEIEGKINETIDILDNKKIDDNFKNKILKPMQDIKLSVESEESIPAITYNIGEIDSLVDTAIIQVNEHLGEKVGDENIEIQTFKPSSYATKTFIETEDDVDDYLKELKERLLEVLSKKKKIRLQ